MGAGRARRRVARLPHRLVRDAAGVDDGDVGLVLLDVAVTKQSLADCVRVRVRHLAAEEADLERGHGSGMLLPPEEIGGPIGQSVPREVIETGEVRVIVLGVPGCHEHPAAGRRSEARECRQIEVREHDLRVG